MPSCAYIRGWLELVPEHLVILKPLIEDELSRVRESMPFVAKALECWIWPPETGCNQWFAFFGAEIHLSLLDYFRDLFQRIATTVSFTEADTEYYPVGVFHIQTDDGRLSRWCIQHGKMREVEGSEVSSFFG